MDRRYKDIHIFNKNGDEIYTRRQCSNIQITDNVVRYETESNLSLIKPKHEILITDITGVKVVID